jgi:phosphate transport system protein
MSLRQHYDERLEEIRSDILRMGAVAGDMVRLAVEATVNGDIELARQVVAMDDEVDNLEVSTINKTVLTFAMEAPVASDLRLLVATLGVIGEIEKVGDDAVKLSRRARKLTGHFPAEMRRALLEMGESVRQTFAASIRLYTDYDGEHAQQIIASDEEIDGQYVKARDYLFELIQKSPHDTAQLVRTIEAFHALEHVADHAVEIAYRLQLHYGTQAAADTPPYGA